MCHLWPLAQLYMPCWYWQQTQPATSWNRVMKSRLRLCCRPTIIGCSILVVFNFRKFPHNLDFTPSNPKTNNHKHALSLSLQSRCAPFHFMLALLYLPTCTEIGLILCKHFTVCPPGMIIDITTLCSTFSKLCSKTVWRDTWSQEGRKSGTCSSRIIVQWHQKHAIDSYYMKFSQFRFRYIYLTSSRNMLVAALGGNPVSVPVPAKQCLMLYKLQRRPCPTASLLNMHVPTNRAHLAWIAQAALPSREYETESWETAVNCKFI